MMKRAKEAASDVAALAGAALMTQGAAMLHPAAGFIAGGAFALVVAVALHRSSR